MKPKKKAPRSAAKLCTLDEFLEDEGKLEEFEAVAVKEAPGSSLTSTHTRQPICRRD